MLMNSRFMEDSVEYSDKQNLMSKRILQKYLIFQEMNRRNSTNLTKCVLIGLVERFIKKLTAIRNLVVAIQENGTSEIL
jgi:hypothetical protein